MNAETDHVDSGEELRQNQQKIAAHVSAMRPPAPERSEAMNDHLMHLIEALRHDSQRLFDDYVGWDRITWSSRHGETSDLTGELRTLTEAIAVYCSAATSAAAALFVSHAVGQNVEQPQMEINDREPLAALAQTYLEALLGTDRHMACALILDAADAGTSVQDLYTYVLQPVQREIGRLWQLNRISVGEEHYATAVTQMVMSQLYPRITRPGTRATRTVVATCAAGELHEVGARMVADVLEMTGWRSIYLGANTPIESVVSMLELHSAQLLTVSASMTRQLPGVRQLIAAVRSEPRLRDVRILVGGYPFNIDPELWRHVGADATARTAEDALRTVGELVE